MTREMKGEIIRTTEKYIYTCELIPCTIEVWYIKTADGIIGTVYQSQEAAEASRREVELWHHCKTIGTLKKTYESENRKYHRYKR